MRIQCPNCQFEANVPSEKIPSSGIMTNCPKCETKFRVNKPLPNGKTTDLTCPSCKTSQISSNAFCVKCGSTFPKDINEPQNELLKLKHNFRPTIFEIIGILFFGTVLVTSSVGYNFGWTLFLFINFIVAILLKRFLVNYLNKRSISAISLSTSLFLILSIAGAYLIDIVPPPVERSYAERAKFEQIQRQRELTKAIKENDKPSSVYDGIEKSESMKTYTDQELIDITRRACSSNAIKKKGYRKGGYSYNNYITTCVYRLSGLYWDESGFAREKNSSTSYEGSSRSSDCSDGCVLFIKMGNITWDDYGACVDACNN